MSPTALRPSRRTLIALALVALVVSAGCLAGSLGDGGDGGDGNESTDEPAAASEDPAAQSDGAGDTPSTAPGDLHEYVPGDVPFFYHVDGAVFRDDETIAFYEGVAGQFGGNSEVDLRATMDMYADRTGLDPREIESMITFGASPVSPQGTNGGLIVASDWETAAFIEAVQAQSDQTFEETTYNGHTVYRAGTSDAQSVWLGVLDDGAFAVGAAPDVRSAIDVAEGDADGLSDRMVETYESAPDGLVTTIVAVDQRLLAGESGSTLDEDLLQQVDTAAIVYSTPTDRIRSDVRLHAADAEGAERIRSALEAALPGETAAADYDRLAGLLEDIEFSTDGATVQASHEMTVEEAVNTYFDAISLSLIAGESSSSTSSQNLFDWSVEGEDIVVTHAGGDEFAEGTLHVENTDGEVVVGATEVDGSLAVGDEIVIEDGTAHDSLVLIWTDGGTEEVVSSYQMQDG